jgi:uncharacterized protein YndB with AHSA1/START domain
MKNTGTLRVAAAGDREIVFTRIFDAPRRVFDALTRPYLLERWHGPHGWSLTVCEVDLEPGGAFRFVWRQGSDAGTDMGMGGVHREVVPPERLVHTERFPGTRVSARPRLRPRCATNRARLATRSSPPRWSTASPRRTTS